MKRFLYILCVTVSLSGLNACKKDSDPEPTAAVVGSWTIDRIRYTGFTGVYASENGDTDATDVSFPLKDNFTVKSDKTFQRTVRLYGQVADFTGNWEFSNNEMSVKYNDGDEETYTLDASKDPNQLLTAVTAVSDSLTNPTTQKGELVRYNVQYVYSKK
jgi:hypothetical protein